MQPLHFLLRYSDKISKVDTIAEHKSVLETESSVWMGKFGVGMGKKFADLAKEQIAQDLKTYLYLMNGCVYTHKATISDVRIGYSSKTGVLTSDNKLTPKYYQNTPCTVWFKLTSIEEITQNDIDNLWLFNSPGAHPSKAGMRGLIYLTERCEENTPKVKKKPINQSLLYTGGLRD